MQAKALASPSGAILATICFFLPWARVSCAPGMGRTISGASLGGAFWLVPALAVAIVAVVVLSKRLGALPRTWPLIPLASVAALAIMAIQSLRLASHTTFGMGSDDVEFTLRAGSVGTVAGLVVALLGGLLLRPRGPGRRCGPGQPGRQA